MNLAQRLLKAEILTTEQLAPALYRQKKNRGFLAKHILDLKLVEPEVLVDSDLLEQVDEDGDLAEPD